MVWSLVTSVGALVGASVGVSVGPLAAPMERPLVVAFLWCLGAHTIAPTTPTLVLVAVSAESVVGGVGVSQ